MVQRILSGLLAGCLAMFVAGCSTGGTSSGGWLGLPNDTFAQAATTQTLVAVDNNQSQVVSVYAAASPKVPLTKITPGVIVSAVAFGPDGALYVGGTFGRKQCKGAGRVLSYAPKTFALRTVICTGFPHSPFALWVDDRSDVFVATGYGSSATSLAEYRPKATKPATILTFAPPISQAPWVDSHGNVYEQTPCPSADTGSQNVTTETVYRYARFSNAKTTFTFKISSLEEILGCSGNLAADGAGRVYVDVQLFNSATASNFDEVAAFDPSSNASKTIALPNGVVAATYCFPDATTASFASIFSINNGGKPYGAYHLSYANIAPLGAVLVKTGIGDDCALGSVSGTLAIVANVNGESFVKLYHPGGKKPFASIFASVVPDAFVAVYN